MKALVTGGTGFIGSHLIEKLRARGDDVRCVAKDRLNAPMLEALGAEVVAGDLNNGIDSDALLEGVDCVYHLAGATKARSSRDYYEGNVLPTRRLIRICAGRPLRRFVYVSSQAACGPSRDGRHVDETTPCRPVSHYGRSKRMAEIELLRAERALPLVIVRPSSVYGPRDRDFFSYFRLVKHHLRVLIGFRRKRISLIHASDLADGILLAGDDPRAIGETFFLTGDEECTIERFAETVADAMESGTLGVRVPEPLVYGVAAVSEALARISRRPVLLNRQKASEMVRTDWRCSSGKARALLEFRPRIRLEDGVRETFRWYRDNRWL